MSTVGNGTLRFLGQKVKVMVLFGLDRMRMRQFMIRDKSHLGLMVCNAAGDDWMDRNEPWLYSKHNVPL